MFPYKGKRSRLLSPPSLPAPFPEGLGILCHRGQENTWKNPSDSCPTCPFSLSLPSASTSAAPGMLQPFPYAGHPREAGFFSPFLKGFETKRVTKEAPRTEERHGAGDAGALGDVFPVCAPGVPLLPGPAVQLRERSGTPRWAGREGRGALTAGWGKGASGSTSGSTSGADRAG